MSMTSRIQKLIEASDLLALHLKCEQCKTVLSFSLQSTVFKIPAQCVNCGSRWRDFEDDMTGKALAGFIEAHRRLVLSLKREESFELRLEVANDPIGNDREKPKE